MMENMGRKIESLLGKSFNTSKLKNVLNLMISRIASLKKEHQARWSRAHSDVIQLLALGQQDSALLRVEHVIREQNTLDFFDIIECYCHLLIERASVIKTSKRCPDELKEAISSLLFAATRCGQLPELQKIHKIFLSRYGKHFATSAIELRSNCGVNPKIAKKLPNRRPSHGAKLKMMKEIVSENGAILQLEGGSSHDNNEEQQEFEKPSDSNNQGLQDGIHNSKQDECFSRLVETRKKYSDARAAAQAAFQLAIHAAAAARVAVELSQDVSNEDDPDHEKNCSFDQQSSALKQVESPKYLLKTDKNEVSKDIRHSRKESNSDKFSFPVLTDSNCSSGEKTPKIPIIVGNNKIQNFPSSDADREAERLLSLKISSQNESSETTTDSDRNNSHKKWAKNPLLKRHEWSPQRTFDHLVSKFSETKHSSEGKEDESDENQVELNYDPTLYIPLRNKNESTAYSSEEDRSTESSSGHLQPAEQPHHLSYLRRGRKPASVRTRRTRQH